MPDPREHGPAAGRSGNDACTRRSIPPDRAPSGSQTVLQMLAAVLADLTYPAQTWQIFVVAEYYGADAGTVTSLRRLPPVSYPSLAHIAHAYIHATGPRPVTPGFRPPPGHEPSRPTYAADQ